MTKFNKLFGSLIGAASAPTIIGYLQIVGLHVDPALVQSGLPFVITVLSALGVYVAPPNAAEPVPAAVVAPEPAPEPVVAPVPVPDPAPSVTVPPAVVPPTTPPVDAPPVVAPPAA